MHLALLVYQGLSQDLQFKAARPLSRASSRETDTHRGLGGHVDSEAHRDSLGAETSPGGKGKKVVWEQAPGLVREGGCRDVAS